MTQGAEGCANSVSQPQVFRRQRHAQLCVSHHFVCFPAQDSKYHSHSAWPNKPWGCLASCRWDTHYRPAQQGSRMRTWRTSLQAVGL